MSSIKLDGKSNLSCDVVQMKSLVAQEVEHILSITKPTYILRIQGNDDQYKKNNIYCMI